MHVTSCPFHEMLSVNDLIEFVVQNFVTDLSSMGVRVNEVNSEAEKIVRAGHPQAQMIRTRQQQLNDKSVT